MFPQIKFEVFYPFVCTRATFALVPPIFVSTVDVSSEAGGMAVCSVALRADVLHIHDFMIVHCVVPWVAVTSWVKDGRTLWYLTGTWFLFIFRN